MSTRSKLVSVRRALRGAFAVVSLLPFPACGLAGAAPTDASPPSPDAGPFAAEDARQARRRASLVGHLRDEGISDPAVLAALGRVPRHRFVLHRLLDLAYDDRALPIEAGQTISQPFVVARMTELARVHPGSRVLEIGTGSGYQAAVLAEVGCEVWTIEIEPLLARTAAARLASMGYDRVHVREGDGYRGWPDQAPFDAILVTAAPAEVPRPLMEQLAVGARLVVPVGVGSQDLTVVTRTPTGYTRSRELPVVFVPMRGEVERAGEDRR